MTAAQSRPLRRVVITGIGVVAPNGIGKEDFWNACISGRSGVQRIMHFDASELPSQIAGEVASFDASAFGLTAYETRRMERGAQLAIAASELALQDSHLPELSEQERNRMGVYMGSAMSCVEEGERLWVQVTDRGTRPVQDSSDIAEEIAEGVALLMTHVATVGVAAHHQLYGPSIVIATACSAGGDAIGEAFWTIQEGRADRMLAGGSDSAITSTGLDVFCVMGAISTHYNDAPERASRPYDLNRDGFVMAEGAAVVLLEERELALARGAHIYAELLTFASNCNAYHMAAPPADGYPLQRIIEQALQEAAISPQEVGYINSHGSSTELNEIAETAAYKAVFGEHAYHIPISATKSLIGHTQGAASAIEAVVTALVVERQRIPPTINQEHYDPRCDLDYVPNVARDAIIDVALTHSSGFGGVNSVLILARPDRIGHHAA